MYGEIHAPEDLWQHTFDPYQQIWHTVTTQSLKSMMSHDFSGRLLNFIIIFLRFDFP